MTVAAGSRIFPMGTKLYIEFDGNRSKYNGIYTVRDTGGDIKRNRIDLFINSYNECLEFGRANGRVKIIKEEDGL